MKRTLAILLTMVLLLALCPAGTLAAEGAAGKYTIFTIDMMGTQTDPAVLGLEGYLALYEDDAGRLVHVLVGPPVYMPDFGETFYTVRSIDDKVDETLFDLSGYTIAE